MKTKSLFVALVTTSTILARAQQPESAASRALDPGGSASTSGAPSYQISERGANLRIWSTVSLTTNRQGTVMTHTNAAYTEIATGMHHLVGEQLVESSPQLQIAASGAEATNAAHKVALLGNANDAGAVDITMPDGRHLTSSVLGLSYYDTASGESVMIGDIKDCQGQLLPSGNEALYPDAFLGVQADLLYINQISGLEQFVVIRKQLPSPSAWDLNPATTVLELITEFTSAPEPQISAVTFAGISDSHLNFGSMQMARGYAFAFGAETNKVRVTKQWLLMEGRHCLVEQVPFQQIESELSVLPPASSGGANLKSSPDSILHRVVKREFRKERKVTSDSQRQEEGTAVAARASLPERKRAGKATAFKIADSENKGNGFVLDYTLLTSQTNLVLKRDTTYYVSGGVNVVGTLTVEGGAVIKYTNTAAASIITTNLVWRSAPYLPAVFTAKDDDTVGDVIGGSTGNPRTNYYAGAALDYSSATNGTVVSNAHFLYLSNALNTPFGPSPIVDSQFGNCHSMIESENGTFSLLNVLCWQCGGFQNQPCLGCDGITLIAQNTTFNSCTNFMASPDGSAIYLTNCILAGVTNGPTYTAVTNSCLIVNDDTGLFQTAGAGTHYLAVDSPYRNAGTTNIDPGLLADLQKKTTYPPIVLSNGPVTANLTLSPVVQRDTDAPDLGYHYDPLDWLTYVYAVTNATVTINPGTAIGYGDTVGLWLQGGAPIVCVGNATAPVRFASTHGVQEMSVKIGAGSQMPVSDNRFGGAAASGLFRFTDIYRVAGGSSPYDLYANGSGWDFSTLEVDNCQLFGGDVQVTDTPFTATNNLFAVTSFQVVGSYPFTADNNLFLRASLDLEQDDVAPFTYRNNSFDSGSIYEGDSAYAPTHQHNAFINESLALFATDPSDLTLTNFVYASGPLGDYYQSSTNLVNEGSTTANLVGLYHFTTQTNQVKETNSVVDIGFHYVAVDGSGNPIDTDGDGVPDYLEDLNGNGVVDSGETDWQNPYGAGDLGLSVLITQPKNNSVIP